MTPSRPIPTGLEAILTAAIPSLPVGKRGSSPSPATVKLVLVVLWLHEGRRVHHAVIAEACGVCDRGAWAAIKTLQAQGLVSGFPAGQGGRSGRAANLYRLHHDRIAALGRVRGDEVVLAEFRALNVARKARAA